MRQVRVVFEPSDRSLTFAVAGKVTPAAVPPLVLIGHAASLTPY